MTMRIRMLVTISTSPSGWSARRGDEMVVTDELAAEMIADGRAEPIDESDRTAPLHLVIEPPAPSSRNDDTSSKPSRRPRKESR